MAEVPSDVRWPPGNSIDFDAIFERVLDLKTQHFPEHTARDLVDPYIQLLVLMSSMGQHAFGRMNHGLKQLTPKEATSRRALLALLPVVNRPLLPIIPAQGPIYARVKDPDSLVADQVIVEANQRIAPVDSIDPMFSVDKALVAPSTLGFEAFFYDDSAGTETSLGPVGGPQASFSMEVNDALVIKYDLLAFDGVVLDVSTVISTGDDEISWEFLNSESGRSDSVTNEGTTLLFDVTSYLGIGTALPVGLSIVVTHKPSSITETVDVFLDDGITKVRTSFLGQASPSISTADYEIYAEWRPLTGVTDPTGGFRTTGRAVVSWPIANAFNTASVWARSSDDSYRVRARRVKTGLITGTDTVQTEVDFVSDDADLYVVGAISQGYLRQVTIGSADGTDYQFLSSQSDPIFEPINDPAITIIVGTDTDWEIVPDMSESGSTSKHAVFIEDPDAGWGVMFGNGTIAEKPPQGDSVKITLRTESSQPGDLDPLSEVRSIGGLSLVDGWSLFDGTAGYEPPEVSDRESALRFRASVLPQLSLRTDSVVSEQEIITALTTVTPNRAFFTTSDGRSPFTRALFTTEGAGDRQYRMVVVGPETNDRGEVQSSDLDEAAIWLNGEEVGTRRVGGRGVNNTEAIMSSFIEKDLIPTITITVPNPSGIRDQIDQIVRNFFKPHSRDEDEEFRWEFGGTIPVALLFALVWNAVPSRSNLDVSVSDGAITFDAGDEINLVTFELPTLDPTYDKNTNIVIIEAK